MGNAILVKDSRRAGDYAAAPHAVEDWQEGSQPSAHGIDPLSQHASYEVPLETQTYPYYYDDDNDDDDGYSSWKMPLPVGSMGPNIKGADREEEQQRALWEDKARERALGEGTVPPAPPRHSMTSPLPTTDPERQRSLPDKPFNPFKTASFPQAMDMAWVVLKNAPMQHMQTPGAGGPAQCPTCGQEYSDPQSVNMIQQYRLCPACFTNIANRRHE